MGALGFREQGGRNPIRRSEFATNMAQNGENTLHQTQRQTSVCDVQSERDLALPAPSLAFVVGRLLPLAHPFGESIEYLW